MAYYIFTLFDTTRYQARQDMPNPLNITLGTVGYNTAKREWAMIIRNPEFNKKNKRGDIDTRNRLWTVIPEHAVPKDYRMQVLLLPEEP